MLRTMLRTTLRTTPVAALACLITLAGALAGCSSDAPETPARGDAGGDSSFVPVVDAGACGVTTAQVAVASALHVEQGSALTHASNPPAGGDHYPFWTRWGVYETPVPRGNWIHNLEHGGVALLYRCPDRASCPELAAKVEALAASLPQDPVCATEVPPIRNRVVVTPDPELPEGVEVAAAAWGYTLIARCFDGSALRTFYMERFGRAPEDFCADGVSGVGMDSGTGGSDAPVEDTSDGASD